jgi:hypothetical protein
MTPNIALTDTMTERHGVVIDTLALYSARKSPVRIKRLLCMTFIAFLGSLWRNMIYYLAMITSFTLDRLSCYFTIVLVVLASQVMESQTKTQIIQLECNISLLVTSHAIYCTSVHKVTNEKFS